MWGGREQTKKGDTQRVIITHFSPKESNKRGKLKMIDRKKRRARNKRVRKVVMYTLIQADASMLICRENGIILMRMEERVSGSVSVRK